METTTTVTPATCTSITTTPASSNFRTPGGEAADAAAVNNHPPCHPAAYRAALVLNNMATTLLQQGHYESARRTLSDSLAMMKLAFVVVPSPSTDSTQNSNSSTITSSTTPAIIGHPDTNLPVSPADEEPEQQPSTTSHHRRKARCSSCPETVLHKASQRCARSLDRHPSRCHDDSSTDVPDQPVAVVQVAVVDESMDDDDDHNEKNDDGNTSNNKVDLVAALHYGPSWSEVFCLQISDCYCCTGIDDNAIDPPSLVTKHFGIILYNHGLANFLGASSDTVSLQKKKTKSDKLMERAFKSLKMAKTTFLALLGDTNSVLRHGESDACHNSSSPFLEPSATLDPVDEDADADRDDSVGVFLYLAVISNLESLLFQSQGRDEMACDCWQAVVESLLMAHHPRHHHNHHHNHHHYYHSANNEQRRSPDALLYRHSHAAAAESQRHGDGASTRGGASTIRQFTTPAA
ncbi:hypothetical protein ACA910_008824 [Epithemia clementina (nom. ined.)]